MLTFRIELKLERDVFDGVAIVINMDFIYNKVLLSIKQNKSKELKYELNKHISRRSIGWTLTNGEASQYSGRCLAIDEIHNVIEVLEKLEIGQELLKVMVSGSLLKSGQ